MSMRLMEQLLPAMGFRSSASLFVELFVELFVLAAKPV